MIELKGLSRVFRTDEVETTALERIDLKVPAGDFLAVMGPSGCGKSTLLSILGMLDSPSSGQYLFLEQDIARYGERRLAELRKTSIGFVFQSFNLIDTLTVFENVELTLRYQKVTQSERRQRTLDVLRRFQIDHRGSHLPQQLSGGQQQRVAVARAVVGRPQLILADEPTGNLDSKHGEEVMEMLTDLNRTGTTVIIVTHSERDAQYAKRMVRLFDGRIEMDSPQPQRREAYA
jgi:putative ABC transport system ATP-binding protein